MSQKLPERAAGPRDPAGPIWQDGAFHRDVWTTPASGEALGEPAWEALITGFIQQSAWTSHFYGDLSDEFDAFIARQAGAGDTHEHAA